jgi:Ni/Fe-hydrogenase b-type cytochrome subunit
MIRRTPLPVEHVELELGEPVGLAGVPPEDVVRYAALGSPKGSSDRLEQALVADAGLRGAHLPVATTLEHVPPQHGRPFSVTTLRSDQGALRVARGEAKAVVTGLVHPDNATHARAMLRSARLVAGGYRPLAVAVQRQDEEWELLGFLPVRAWTRPERRRGRPFDYHVVWDVWLRWSHWTWVTAILVLTVTGLVIADPGWVPAELVGGGVPAGFFLGYVRYIHLVAAVVFTLVLVVRAWNLSTSRIPYDRWRALIPFRSRHEVRNLFRTLRAYLFIRAHTAPVYFGHNPLQQLTYTLMYVVFLLQVVTGMALWGLFDAHHWFWSKFVWLDTLIGAQQMRLTHLLIMWLLVLFVPVHVYLSIRADSVERSGAISSMVSGGRWIRRGAVFEDWPPTVRRRRKGRRDGGTGKGTT